MTPSETVSCSQKKEGKMIKWPWVARWRIDGLLDSLFAEQRRQDAVIRKFITVIINDELPEGLSKRGLMIDDILKTEEG